MCAIVLYPQHGICIDFGARELQIRVYCPEIIYKPYGHAVQCTFLQQVDELDFVDFQVAGCNSPLIRSGNDDSIVGLQRDTRPFFLLCLVTAYGCPEHVRMVPSRE